MANVNGFKDYASGEHPSAADFDHFIGEQVIALFDDSTDQTTQLGDPIVDGQWQYLRDSGELQVGISDGGGTPVYEWVTVARAKAFGTYSPALTATSSSPTMGTGPTNVGRITQQGTTVTIGLYVAFGTSMAAGTGTYEISLPAALPANANWHGTEDIPVGVGLAIDSSPGTRKTVVARLVDATKIRLEADGLTAALTESNLLSWGDSDVVFAGTITYETKEAHT